MIFYFSATGNSKYTAQRLAQATGDEAISILDWGGRPVAASSGERLGFVTPDYCGGVPSVAADFLKTARFEVPADVETYLVVTYGNNSGASGLICDRLARASPIWPTTWTCPAGTPPP